MEKYTKTIWVNDSAPYIAADNLNHIEEGIEAVTDGAANIEASLSDYAKKSDIPGDVVTHEEITTTLEEYAKKADLPTDFVKHEELETTLGSYAKKTDLPDLAGYAKTETVEAELEKKANVADIPTKLPTPNNLTITIDGTEYAFDGSAPVAIVFENAESKYY